MNDTAASGGSIRRDEPLSFGALLVVSFFWNTENKDPTLEDGGEVEGQTTLIVSGRGCSKWL